MILTTSIRSMEYFCSRDGKVHAGYEHWAGWKQRCNSKLYNKVNNTKVYNSKLYNSISLRTSGAPIARVCEEVRPSGILDFMPFCV